MIRLIAVFYTKIANVGEGGRVLWLSIVTGRGTEPPATGLN